jgi:mono/diheme cytochrome c family protein
MKKQKFIVISLVLTASFFLAACGTTATPTQAPAATVAPAATEAPVATETPATTTADVAKPSNPGPAGEAVNLGANLDSGKLIYEVNCAMCHGAEGVGGNPNPGSKDGTIPEINPVDPTLVNSDYKTFATNLDLFMEHGSTPEGPNPVMNMPAWGDKGLMTPQQIADVIGYVISLNKFSGTIPSSTVVSITPVPTAAAEAVTEPPATGNVEPAKPSNPGEAGQAVSLTGDAKAGKRVYTENCITCHGDKGVGGQSNPGSVDGTVPPVNPIDSTLKSDVYKTFATNLDLFMEHGSTPEGPNPILLMPAWGDKKLLTPQQIADVIAYMISLNK